LAPLICFRPPSAIWPGRPAGLRHRPALPSMLPWRQAARIAPSIPRPKAESRLPAVPILRRKSRLEILPVGIGVAVSMNEGLLVDFLKLHWLVLPGFVTFKSRTAAYSLRDPRVRRGQACFWTSRMKMKLGITAVVPSAAMNPIPSPSK